MSASFALPQEGFVNPMDAIENAMAKGQFTMVAPDGRIWFNSNPMIIIAALSAIMAGEDLQPDLGNVH